MKKVATVHYDLTKGLGPEKVKKQKSMTFNFDEKHRSDLKKHHLLTDQSTDEYYKKLVKWEFNSYMMNSIDFKDYGKNWNITDIQIETYEK